jgi:hypothetical protein
MQASRVQGSDWAWAMERHSVIMVRVDVILLILFVIIVLNFIGLAAFTLG